MRERFRVKITRRAEIDLDEIWAYIATDNVDYANRFVLKIEKRMKTLAWSPGRCPSIPENEILGTEYRHLVIRKYRAPVSNLRRHGLHSSRHPRSEIVGYLDN